MTNYSLNETDYKSRKVTKKIPVFDSPTTNTQFKMLGYICIDKFLSPEDFKEYNDELSKYSMYKESYMSEVVKSSAVEDLYIDRSIPRISLISLCQFKDCLTGLNLDDFKMLLEMYTGERIDEKSAIKLMTLLNRKDVDIYYKSK